MSYRLYFLPLTLVLGCVGVSAEAFAQSSDPTARAAARRLGSAGVEAYQAGDYAVASEKLEKAYAVMHAPSLGLWAARSLVKLGKLVEAADRYLETTRLPIEGGEVAVQKKAQADAQLELEAIQSQIPTLVVRVQGSPPAAVKLTIDGVSVSSELVGEATPVNPGAHRVEGVLGEFRAVSEVSVAEREQKSALLVFPEATASAAEPAGSEASSPAEPGNGPPSSEKAASSASTRRTLGFVALGVGGAGLLFGGVTGGWAISKKSSLDNNPACADDHSCPANVGADVDSYSTMRTLSSVGFIAGGVLAAAGVALVLTSPRPDHGTALLVSPNSVALRGSF